MTIGGSLFLIAVGAILKFAVTADVSGIDLQTVGVILMVIGVVLYSRTRRVVATRGPNDPLI